MQQEQPQDPPSSRAECNRERWWSQAEGRVPGRSTHPYARCLPASTCPVGPGRSPRRGCPRGRCPAAAGACRCSQGTACRRRTWLSAPSSGWVLQRRSRDTTGSHRATAASRGTQGQGWLGPQPARLSLPASPCSPASHGSYPPARPTFLPIDEQGLISASFIIQQDFLVGLGAIFSSAAASIPPHYR